MVIFHVEIYNNVHHILISNTFLLDNVLRVNIVVKTKQNKHVFLNKEFRELKAVIAYKTVYMFYRTAIINYCMM